MKKWIGVDLHRKQFTVCIVEGDEERIKEYEVSEKGIESFKKEIDKRTEVALEATGNSGYFRDKIKGKAKKVILVNPLEFKVISSSAKKTDKNDARVIAKYLRVGLLPEVRAMTEEERELRSLINLRDTLVKSKSGYKTLIDNILSAIGKEIKGNKESEEYEKVIERHEISEVRRLEIKELVGQIKSLRESIKKLEKEIKERGRKGKGHKGLTSISGIGELSATIIENAILRAEDFEDEKKVCSYAGLVPVVKDSGSKRKRGRIKHGNKMLRTTLVQAALTAIRTNKRLREFYDRIKNKKGHGKAIVATARKLLVIAYYTMKHGWVFKDFNSGELEMAV